MASSDVAGDSLPPNFLLTPHQQSLLFAALNADKGHVTSSSTAKGASASLNSPESSTMPLAEDTGTQESPYLDNYEYELGDLSFDLSPPAAGGDRTKMMGHVSGATNLDSAEAENSEKRSYPDDGEDDSSPGNDSKRRESAEKISKKPGRKPLTSEPTSKRKAQNRAAQRAFRERKEKHLKDLETKVEELEKASEAANHENSKLRSQVSHMTTELNQYKQRLAVMMHKPASRDKSLFGDAALNNFSDVSFQFEFPKFGSLPGPPPDRQSTAQPKSAQSDQQRSPTGSLGGENKSPRSSLQQSNADESIFAGAFTPSLNGSTGHGSRTSFDSVPCSVAAANSSSPSACSNSNAGGPSSSCGTSPESLAQSPSTFKPLETLTTIGEEQPAATMSNHSVTHLSNVDVGSPSFDWLVQQNGGGSFDPQLFGDYREPQENVLSNPSFDDFVFNDGLDTDFFTPFNTAPPADSMSKKSLIAKIDAQQDAIEENNEGQDVVICPHQFWEKLQECPKAQSGDFDLDGLCSELTKKARCSGSGPVVHERDFHSILNKFMGKDAPADGVADKLGITVKPNKQQGVTMP